MSKKSDDKVTPAKPVAKKAAKAIIVVGDLMIDQTWLLSGLPSETAQSHSDVSPIKRAHPSWESQRLGGAGMSLMALRLGIELLDLDYELHCLGVWQQSDTSEINRLSKQGFESSTGTECKFHQLDLDASSNPQVTVKKVRYATHLTDDRPTLFARYDQDPNEDYTFSADPLRQFTSSASLPSPEDVHAVYISDFKKGAVTPAVIKALRQWLSDQAEACVWICDTKNSDTQLLDALPDSNNVILSVNRDELARLAYPDPQDRLPIPAGNSPSLELLTAVESLTIKDGDGALSLTQGISEIAVKLDEDGAAVFYTNPGKKGVVGEHCNPSHRIDCDGIAAGDFFNAGYLLSVLAGNDERGERLEFGCFLSELWLDFSTDYWKDNAYSSDVVQVGFVLGQGGIRKSAQGKFEDISKRVSKHFNLREQIDTRKSVYRYVDLVRQGKNNKPILIRVSDATGFLGDFGATDPILRRDISTFVDEIRTYTSRTGPTRPLNCLVVASPGSGKSFFAKEVAKQVDCELVEVNCSQMHDGRDLLRSIANLQNVPVDKTPLLFLDEVDTREQYYPMLLAPLWDAEAEVDGSKRRLRRKMVTISVASGVDDPEAFMSHLRNDDVIKGEDLASRLKGPQLALTERSSSPESLTHRVYMLMSMLLRHHTGCRYIHRGVPDLLYAAKKFNARAAEQFVLSMSEPVSGVLQISSNAPSEVTRLNQFAHDLDYDIGTKYDLKLSHPESERFKELDYGSEISNDEISLRAFCTSGRIDINRCIRIRK